MAKQSGEPADPARLAFGLRVRHLRLERGLSQERLAEMAEIHRTYMSDIERGARNIGLDNILALARALDVSAAEFFRPG